MAVRIAVIGAGVMGADHAKTLASATVGATLVAVADPDEGRAMRVAVDCGLRFERRDPFELIRATDVDAVLVASPDETHASFVLAAIAAGKPVLCEKPLAATLDECRNIITAETAVGRRLVQVGFMRRFDPGYVSMRHGLREGRFGPALFLHCVHRNAVAPPFMTSDMVITNAGVHEIDVARWLLDDEFGSATVVTARSAVEGRSPYLLVLETRSGIVVDVELFVDATYGYDVRAELVCRDGTASLAPNVPVLDRHAGREGFEVVGDWRARFATAYRNQVQAWVNSIATNRPVGASAWDGYAASAIAAGCVAAARSGARTTLVLDPRPALYEPG